MKRLKMILILTFVLVIFSTVLWATEKGWSEKLATLTVTDVDPDDMFMFLIDPNGTPTSGLIGRTEALLDWPGSTNITSVGTVAAGTWQGSVVDHERGGIETDISAIADGGILVGTGAGAMAIRASYMTAGAAGTITHELGGLQADVSGWTGLFGITGADTSIEVDTFAELDTAIADKALVNQADGATWTGSHDYSGATVTMPKRTKNDDKKYRFNFPNPNAFYDLDTQFCFEPNLPANITITEVTITLDADPATELDWDLKYADAFIGLANATLIVAIDTTNGTTDVDAGWNDNTVVAGKVLYVEFAADPDSNITQAMVKIRYDFD